MPCGKKPLIKRWDHPRCIPKISPSKYEQNEPSVKLHWRNVVKELELSYKDDKFWETQSELVRSLVGPTIFRRLTKIFSLENEVQPYIPSRDVVEEIPSEQFYSDQAAGESRLHQKVSTMSIDSKVVEEEEDENMEESYIDSDTTYSSSSTIIRNYSQKSGSKLLPKSISKMQSSRAFNKSLSRKTVRSHSRFELVSFDESASTDDDLIVHPASKITKRTRHRHKVKNPHFDMLYCNESETDMIKWPSNYKRKSLEVSASDEFNKKAEILAKKISKEFYDWWLDLGTGEFKSELKQPSDIEELFQVWFDEHASRSLVLDPKILPCVLSSIAKYVNAPKTACSKVLKRQIAYDIHAETSPAHTMAFNTCLPLRMKHIPPKNNTKSAWQSLKIPEDLRSMSCVWEDIKHLTSTKAFQRYLEQHPDLPTPPCLLPEVEGADKKELFVVPSDFVVREQSSLSSTIDLALPVSQLSIELKEVLAKLMNE